MNKTAGRVVLMLLLGISGLIIGCAELYRVPPTYPPGAHPSPNAQPLPQTQPSDPAFPAGAVTADKFEALAARVNTLALQTAAATPPGPVQTGALGVAAIASTLLAGNELLKKLFGNKRPPGN